MPYRFAFRKFKLPFHAPIRTAHGLWTEREGVLVRIEDERGGIGYGEAAPISWFGNESVADVEAACQMFGAVLPDTWSELLPARISTLRFALWSAQRDRGAEASKADAAHHKYLPVAALLPAGRLALQKVDALLESGFRAFKWKVGVADIADELALLDDLLGRLPSGAKLRTDANGAWDSRRAQRWLERCAERPIEFVEQPVSPDAKNADDTLLGLAGDFPTVLALDESIATDGDIERWLERGWPGVYVVKPALLARPEATLARLAHARAAVVFSSALETAVGAKAALRAAFSYSGEPRALGMGVWPLFQDARFDGPTAAPFIRFTDVEAIDSGVLWNALG